MLAPPGAYARAAEARLVVRNHSMLDRIHPAKYRAPGGLLRPVELVGVKNGAFAAQLVVCAPTAIRGLVVSASRLTGPAALASGAVEVRYALPDGAARGRGSQSGAFDSLDAAAPAEVTAGKGGAVQPVWITVRVPADARPGQYTGSLTVAARDCTPVEVPLRLRVIDWALPDANDFTPRLDIVQSPESVAMAYDVGLWSDEHLALLDKTFALLKPLAAKTVYISAIRRTHFGNEHAMVRWVRDADGELQPNFDHVEAYLDVAVRHLGKVPGVILYCWEPVSSMGHAGGTGGAGRTHDKPILYTLWDRKRDRLKKRKGPAWGTPEAKAFWGRFNKGITAVLRKRGLEGSMLYGLIGDARPTKQAMDDITTGVKDAKWAVHSHHDCKNWMGYDIGMCVALWGIHLNVVDPKNGRGYGWRSGWWLAYYPREFSLTSSLVEQRYKLEMWMGAFSQHEMRRFGKSRTACGLGRIGGDFWIVLKDSRGRRRYSLPGRYPESYWGQLNLNYCIPHILGRGERGPLPTVRSEAFREGIQEVEARVFIERALLDKARRARLGDDLAGRCRTFLDERIRMVNRAGKPRKDQVSRLPHGVGRLDPDWRKKGEMLFEFAAEVAKRLDR
jgi:hypothetical protein